MDAPITSLLDPSQLAAAVTKRWEIAAQDAVDALERTLAVAFVGSASSGKDSAIRAIFGVDFGQIDPVPGSTARAMVAALSERVLIVNAPGFGDLRGEVEAEAKGALEHADVIVYVLNCDGGVSADERRDFDALRALGRPTLVCLNKIDLIRVAQREAFVRATLGQLGVSSSDAVVCAFDPLLALEPAPIGVDDVLRWIAKQLDQNGKALLFAKAIRNRASAADVIIRGAARQAAIAGAIPIPGADMTAITVVQVRLITELASIYGRRMDKSVALFIIGEVLAGSSRGFIRWSLEALKTAGWVPGGQVVQVATSALGASLAGATTWGVGKAAVAFFESDLPLDGVALREIFDVEADQWQRAAAEPVKQIGPHE